MMVLPASIGTVTIRGKYATSLGGVAQGTVTFYSPSYLVSTIDDTIVAPKAIPATLAADGTFSVVVPKGTQTMTYKVTERLTDPLDSRTYYIDVLSTDTTFDLSDKAPVSVIQQGSAYLTQAILDDPSNRLSDAAQRAAFVASTGVRSMVALTPAQYAALGTKDPNTLYLSTVAEFTDGPTTGDLSDTFATTSGLWELVNGTASVSAGNLDLTPIFDTPGPETHYRTVADHALTSSIVGTKIGQLPTTGNASAYMLFVFGAAPTHDCLAFTWEAGTLYFQYRNGTTRTTLGSIAGLNLGTDGYWRYRHDGTNIYWETGPDGVTYTTRAALAASALTWSTGAGRVAFDTGYYDTEATPAAPHVLVAGVNAA